MCLSIPAEVIVIAQDGSDTATVEINGVKKEISLALVESVVPGDYVLVHVGYALEKLNIGEVEKTLALMASVRFPAAASGSSGTTFG